MTECPSTSVSRPTSISITFHENRHLFAVERGKNTSSAASSRARVPGGPAIKSGRSRWARNWASSRRNGSAPKWSPCRCESTTPSMRLGSRPCALSATSEVAPQSTRSVPFADSTKKHVLNRPPEPKASPDPTIVRRMLRPMRSAARKQSACQRLRLVSSSGTASFAGFMKSTATRPVISAIEKASPATNARCFNSRIEQADEFLDARLVGLGPGGDLWHLHLLHGRMRVAKNV